MRLTIFTQFSRLTAESVVCQSLAAAQAEIRGSTPP